MCKTSNYIADGSYHLQLVQPPLQTPRSRGSSLPAMAAVRLPGVLGDLVLRASRAATKHTRTHTHTVQPTTHHLKIHLASSYSNFQKSHTCLSLCLFRESGAAFTPRLFEAMNHGHIIKLQWADTSSIKRTGGNIFGVFALSISHALLTSLCLSCL